jgi:hypothetical protein
MTKLRRICRKRTQSTESKDSFSSKPSIPNSVILSSSKDQTRIRIKQSGWHDIYALISRSNGVEIDFLFPSCTGNILVSEASLTSKARRMTRGQNKGRWFSPSAFKNKAFHHGVANTQSGQQGKRVALSNFVLIP